MTRAIQSVVRKAKLGASDTDGERSSYWQAQPIAARIAELESLRRMWVELTGDPDQPIQRVVRKRRFGER